MSRHRIYTDIVGDSQEVVGLVAYGLYKSRLVEAYEAYRQHHGVDDIPPDKADEMRRNLTTRGQKDQYRSQAELLIKDMLDYTLSEREQFECMGKLNRMEYKGFWHGVGVNTVSNLFGTVAAGLMAFFIAVAVSGGMEGLKKNIAEIIVGGSIPTLTPAENTKP